MELKSESVTKALLVLLAAGFMLMPLNAVQADSARSEVASLVRLLGYGGGIHSFKNYVLRGQDQHHASAQKAFHEVMQTLQRLEQYPQYQAADKEAITVIRTTVSGYQAGLNRVAELRGKNWRLEDIDRAVAVDDSAAIAALDRLRDRWQWSDIEQIEYHLGYGKGIHNFKNYVLRQQERYHTQALENLLAVESLIVNQFNTRSLTEKQKSELVKVARVAQSYRNYLALIERLHSMQRTERQIDLAVKVNDGPAIAALASLTR